MRKVYPVFGIIAPLFYILAVVIGGYLVQGYSHLYNSISELTVSNAPKIPIIYILFFIYNILVVLFGAGLYHDLKTACNNKPKIASLMIITIGLLGIAMLYYVQDPRTGPISFNGMMHIILAAISSILSMAIIILSGLSFRSDPKLKKFTKYSFISFGIVFITGGIAAITTANNSLYGGLFERFTIGAFMQWLFVIATALLREARN